MKRKNYKLLLVLCLLTMAFTGAHAQFYSARTNLVGLGTGNLNAEFSATLNRKWSVHLPVQYNPFIWDKTTRKQWRNLYISPGVRYWWRESYTGGFMGVHAVAAKYSIGRVFDDYRYLGYAWGLGASVGKAYPIAKKWNIEWEVGLAGVYTTWDKYICKECGKKLDSDKKFFLAPSKIALNIVYLF